jgi:hypothetical protein
MMSENPVYLVTESRCGDPCNILAFYTDIKDAETFIFYQEQMNILRKIKHCEYSIETMYSESLDIIAKEYSTLLETTIQNKRFDEEAKRKEVEHKASCKCCSKNS